MPVVNFTIPAALEKRVQKAVKERGFTSRAEFFRAAALREIERPAASEGSFENNPHIRSLVAAIDQEFVKKLGNRRLPSVREQFKRPTSR